jgi:hypothetical protein
VNEGLGPFFAVHTHEPNTSPPPPWRAMSELIDDPATLHSRVEQVRTYLAAGRPPGTVELRVAASVTHLGLVARLLSPTVAIAATSDALLDIDLRRTWWQPVLGGPFPLSVQNNPTTGATHFADRILNGPIRTLNDAVGELSVSQHILWGNVASALNGTATMLTRTRPLVTELLTQPPLAGTSTTTNDRFRRRSCCLIYRADPTAHGPVCGDCVLSRR